MEMTNLGNTTSFLEACHNIGKELLKSDNSRPFYVFSHFDADGLTAAAIIAKTLSREGLNFHLRIFERLEYDSLNDLRKSIPKGSTIIFLDLGTGIIETFIDWQKSHKIFILDHHTPSSEV